MIALGTIIAVSTIVGAIGVLTTSVVHVPTGEMTGSLALRALLEIAVAGTLVQISLASWAFVWEKYRHRRMVARHSNKAAESRLGRGRPDTRDDVG